jgi:hypothetical protein
MKCDNREPMLTYGNRTLYEDILNDLPLIAAKMAGKIEDVKAKRKPVAAAPAAPAHQPQPTLKELFAQRDATQPGSKEEDQALERIIGAMFPDSNSDGIR